MEVWHDLAYMYINLSQWHDAELCLSKSKSVSSYSAVRWHVTGKHLHFLFYLFDSIIRGISRIFFKKLTVHCFAGFLYESKGLYKEALKAFLTALDIDPTHVPSLVSTAVVLRKLGNQTQAVVRSFLMEALRLDRMNHSAWYNLGLSYEAKGTASSALEATECFETAIFLEESAPVEPFR